MTSMNQDDNSNNFESIMSIDQINDSKVFVSQQHDVVDASPSLHVSSEEEEEEQNNNAGLSVVETQCKQPIEKYKELPLNRITEVSRESGTFEVEETEYSDRRSQSQIYKQMMEVLRLQVEHF